MQTRVSAYLRRAYYMFVGMSPQLFSGLFGVSEMDLCRFLDGGNVTVELAEKIEEVSSDYGHTINLPNTMYGLDYGEFASLANSLDFSMITTIVFIDGDQNPKSGNFHFNKFTNDNSILSLMTANKISQERGRKDWKSGILISAYNNAPQSTDISIAMQASLLDNIAPPSVNFVLMSGDYFTHILKDNLQRNFRNVEIIDIQYENPIPYIVKQSKFERLTRRGRDIKSALDTDGIDIKDYDITRRDILIELQRNTENEIHSLRKELPAGVDLRDIAKVVNIPTDLFIKWYFGRVHHIPICMYALKLYLGKL